MCGPNFAAESGVSPPATLRTHPRRNTKLSQALARQTSLRRLHPQPPDQLGRFVARQGLQQCTRGVGVGAAS